MKLSNGKRESITELNITPFVDVILVLLIIFMATAPLINRRSMNINVPSASHTEPKATAAINILYNENREILMEQEKTTLGSMAYQLAVMVKADPMVHVVLQADKTIPYGEVVEVLDAIRGSGIKRLALELRSKKIAE